ncbi:uncharacterized protein BDR25DRAFT_326363 [Lindgomyces ingoldianus]|uniref:Uncharacterized protein n=1 Tax=Lindgomyces ingoldianus TaxID=673940 RepID=A0ACB6QQ33_9PLEO|nr:uncharacterized protein BDR25DRAFT_326363 [Lindgomyces ingoldianus]KAF2469109.1 hypothetical protein BDR25DRAFT_326363 [Lindgomyces ingoldianus]
MSRGTFPSLVPSTLLKYEYRPEWSDLADPWALPPGHSLDALWDDLLYAQNIHIPEHEFEALEENVTYPVQTLNGDYVGVIGIYHHLHCLDALRRVVHWDYYGPRASEKALEEGIYSKAHSGNESGPKVDLGPTTGIMHKCVDWKSLDGWARGRAVRRGQARYRLTTLHES